MDSIRLCCVEQVDIPDKYLEASLAHYSHSFGKVLSEDTEVVMKCVKGGLKPDNPLDGANPYFEFLNSHAVIETYIEAEREGFDAVWTNCFAEPGVREARGIVNIPIIGACESTLHFACQLGRKLAIIHANIPGETAKLEEQVRLLGLEGRLITDGVRPEREPFIQAFRKGQKDAQFTATEIEAVAKECVADGADVIVIGCCGTGPICSKANLYKVAINGQEVPVVDPVMVAAKTAEMAAKIRKATGMPIPSRTGNHVLPSKEDWGRVRAVFGLNA